MTLSIDDILHGSDSAVDNILEQHRQSNGGFTIPLEGWQTLSAEERQRLAQRLKYHGQSLSCLRSFADCF